MANTKHSKPKTEPERPTFVFMHVGPDISLPTYMVRSIKAHNDTAYIIQCTDNITSPIPGADRVFRIGSDAAKLMTFRLECFAKLDLKVPALYLDTDMLIVSGLDPAKILGDFDVAVCLRQFDNEKLCVLGDFDLSEYAGKNLGTVYPYVSCSTITRNAKFWQDCFANLMQIDPKYHRWFGDQEAIRNIADNKKYRIKPLLESVYACLPDGKQFAPERPCIYHFKGPTRKHQMVDAVRKAGWICERRSLASPPLIAMKWLHRRDPENVGDMMSCPANYLEGLSSAVVTDILRRDIGDICAGETVILGGGSLLSPFFEPFVEAVLARASLVIGWGIGTGWPADKRANGNVSGQPSWGHHLLRKFALAGVRDRVPLSYDHVPCASCLSPLFADDGQGSIRHDTVIYAHRRMPLTFAGFPYLTHEADFESAIGFLKSGRRIVTNSYHGAYWGLLLGREVAAIPWCAKFFHLGESLQLARYEDVPALLAQPAAGFCDGSRDYYRNSVAANIRFHAKLGTTLDMPAIATDRQIR